MYLIIGIIEKTQTKYLAGYPKAAKLLKDNNVVTEYAWNWHKKLVKGALKRKVFITQERDNYVCGKVSRESHSSFPRYIEVAADTEAIESNCPCMFYQENGMCCEHIIALLRKVFRNVRDRWWFAERYHVTTYHSCYIADVPTFAFEKLEADIFFVPPEYKKPAGRPTKTRKDCSYLNKTSVQHQCSSCGGLGHSFRTCDRPSTQVRFENHYSKAVAWTRAFSTYDVTEEV